MKSNSSFVNQQYGLLSGLGALETDDIPAWAVGKRQLTLETPWMRGDDVRWVQLQVGASPDGIFGPITFQKVKDFQQSQGLIPTGSVGGKTWIALDGYSKTNTNTGSGSGSTPTNTGVVPPNLQNKKNPPTWLVAVTLAGAAGFAAYMLKTEK